MVEDLGTLLLAAFVMLASPGPAPVALAAATASSGYRRTLPFYGGVMTGLFVAMVLSAFGFFALLSAFPLAATLLLAASLSYVVYLAWKIATAPPIDPAAVDASSASRLRFRDGVAINIINPKVYAAFATLYASFVPAGLGEATGLAVTGLAGFGVALVTNNIWMLAGSGLARLFATPRQNRILRIALAIMMLSAVLLAVYKLAESGIG